LCRWGHFYLENNDDTTNLHNGAILNPTSILHHVASSTSKAAVTVDDAKMIEYTKVMGRNTGIFPAPEGTTCLAAQVRMIKDGWIQPDETVLPFNTGTGLKYSHIYV
jgi:threonine synthase